ncbi:MAG: 6-bladed beta-propeller [Candidatus Aminicenantes bacterium]|nr:6-bladed beta-propeller [Candidatus Aminicenantes bacterium]
MLIIPTVFSPPIQAAENNRVIEKLIPVVEILSLESKYDQNYLFNSPFQLEVLNDKLFVLDTYNNRIQVFDLEGNYLKTLGKKGKGPGEFNAPEGFYLDSLNQKIYVADTRNLRLQILELEGKESAVIKLTFAPRRSFSTMGRF